MGYTHYFSIKKTSKEQWNKIVTDCKKLHSRMPKHSKSSGAYHADDPLLIDGCSDSMFPQFTEKEILFNGTDKDFKWEYRKQDKYPALSHETFHLERDPKELHPNHKRNGFIGNFCKTARKPYDLMVQACLLVYKHHSPDTIKLGSDGDIDDWKEAEKFVKRVLGYEIQFKTCHK